MLLALTFLLLATLFGITIIRLVDIKLEAIERWLVGLVIGVVVTTWLSFILSLLVQELTVWPVLGLIAILVGATVQLWLVAFQKRFRFECRHNWLFLVTIVFWGIFLAKLFSQMLVTTSQGIWAGGSNVWGDWAGHMGYIANWMYGDNFPLQNPWYSGILLSYPFLFDFTSSMLVNLGMTVSQSMEIPGFIFALVIVVLLFRLTIKVAKNQMAGVLAVAIFMLSGGLGWVYLLPTQPVWLQSLFPQPAGGIKELTHVYEANIQWVNFVISEMVPQRGILIGISVALAIFILWWKGAEVNNKNYFLVSGFLAGLVPLFHTHTFIVLAAVGGVMFLLRPQKLWWYFAIPAGVLALPQMAYFLPQVEGYQSGFIRWQPGWTAHVQNDNWIWFWVKNIGLMFFLIPLAWIKSWRDDRKLFWIYLPFAIIFAASNLWIFQPWENDNSKLLRFWYLASSILVAWWVVRLTQGGILKKAGVGVLLLLVVLAGAVDALSWLNFDKNKLLLWSQQEIELAQIVKEITPKDSIFLTTDAHNHWVVDLAGRKIVMGFRGWLWSWGINYGEREKDVGVMFRGDYQTPELLRKYAIDYVIIGPGERNAFKGNEEYFIQNYPLLLDMFGQKIFKVS